MPVVFIIDAFVTLWLIYIATVLLHLMGVKVFNTKELHLGRALIPFYYWLHNEKKKQAKEKHNTNQTQEKNGQI